jgi:RecB family endonuclease NucS
VELYNPDTHGLWELRINEYGKLEAAQCGFAEGDSEAPVPDTLDELAFPLESHLRDFLASNIEEIKPNGQNLRLYADASGSDGIEYPTDVGPIDILALDTDGHFVGFELKLSKGPDRAMGQVLRYMVWVHTSRLGNR